VIASRLAATKKAVAPEPAFGSEHARFHDVRLRAGVHRPAARRVVCEELTVDDLFQIMKRSEGSIVRQYERAFRAYGIAVSFDDDALREIARQAAEENTGARGLLTVCERILRNFKYELPSSGVTELVVNGQLVASPDYALQQLLRA
jgi:ATP-dependent protease Clp ATPase subunit